MTDPCLAPVSTDQALALADKILSHTGTATNTIDSSLVEVNANDLHQLSFTQGGNPFKPTLPPAEWLFMWGPRDGMEPKITAVCKVPFSDFETPMAVSGGKTELARAFEELFKVIGPRGIAMRKICGDDFFMQMAKDVKNPKMKKLLPGSKKAKVTEEQRLETLSEDMIDAMEEGKTELAFKPYIKFRTDKKTGDQFVQLVVEQRLFEERKVARTEEETAKLVGLFDEESPVVQWIQEHDRAQLKKRLDNTFSTRFSQEASWLDLIRTAGKYTSARAVCQAKLFMFRLQMSQNYGRLVFTTLIEDMNVFGLTSSTTKKRTIMSAFESACFEELHPSDAKRARVNEPSMDGDPGDSFDEDEDE